MARPANIPRGSELFEQLHARAYHLRIDRHMTLPEIAEDIGVSVYQARALLEGKDGLLPRKHKYRAVYPALEEWVLTEYGSMAACSRALGWRNTLLENLIYWGGPFTRKQQIDQLLELSGLTYETAFKEDDDK